MSKVDLEHVLENMLASWFGSGQAQITSTDIKQAAGDAGYDPSDLDKVDMTKVYQNACQHPGVPADYVENAQHYSGSGDFESVVRQIQQVTEVHNTQQFFDNSTNVDNSIDLSGATVSGGLDIENNPVTADDGGVAAGAGSTVTGVATGDGAEATGSGDINHASGGSTLIDGDNYGQANSGAGAAQVDQGIHLGDPGYIIDPVRGTDPPVPPRPSSRVSFRGPGPAAPVAGEHQHRVGYPAGRRCHRQRQPDQLRRRRQHQPVRLDAH